MAKSPAPTPAAMQAKHDDMKKRWDAVLTAFEPDSFSAKKLDLSMGGKPHDEMEKRVTFVTGLLPILRPDQRDKFASTIERAHGPEGGPGHPGHNEGEVDQGTDFEVP